MAILGLHLWRAHSRLGKIMRTGVALVVILFSLFWLIYDVRIELPISSQAAKALRLAGSLTVLLSVALIFWIGERKPDQPSAHTDLSNR